MMLHSEVNKEWTIADSKNKECGLLPDCIPSGISYVRSTLVEKQGIHGGPAFQQLKLQYESDSQTVTYV